MTERDPAALAPNRGRQARSAARAEASKGGSGDIRAALGFDPDRIREAREATIEAAQKAPLFSNPAPRRVAAEQYPNVHNS